MVVVAFLIFVDKTYALTTLFFEWRYRNREGFFMEGVQVEVVGQTDLPIIADMYNVIFRPARNVEFFRRRLLGRYNPLLLVASINNRPVGFATGFELKPTVFFGWLLGVLPDYRRGGIAKQLCDALFTWAAEHNYELVRMECHNTHRTILAMSVNMEFDIVGLRWDSDRTENLIILEKKLDDSASGNDE